MVIYAAFEAYHDGVDEHRQLHKVFKLELDAIRWTDQVSVDDYVFRFYQPIELE